MEYSFSEIEKKWQEYWKSKCIYHVEEDSSKPKYYVLDMFPYPSGAGLHVGHPLGYIASDIYSRYKRLQGFNVLHPMGYDAYGLPAEQYAILTGQHPAITTENNISRYREQMDKLGFCYDWAREVRTCDSKYYRWTQWAFIQMFNSYYRRSPSPALPHREGSPSPALPHREGSPSPTLPHREGSPSPTLPHREGARPVSELVQHFERQGSMDLDVACTEEMTFSADEWNGKSEKEKQETLMNYRIAYLADTMVNWCPALGTVLANDEVSEGVSVRGGHPVEQKLMRQWSLRVSAYAQRLLDGLDTIDWTESLKETQRNWIGRSEGAEMRFKVRSPSPTLPRREGLYKTARTSDYGLLKALKKEKMRQKITDAESYLWQNLKGEQFATYKFRREHIIDRFIVDFVCLSKQLVIEVDGGYHNDSDIIEDDRSRTKILNSLGYQVIRFTNEEVLNDTANVIGKIKDYLSHNLTPKGGDRGGLLIFTTRPDTIYGATFMVLAPESEYVALLTTPEHQDEVDAYLDAVKRRTERERISDRRITGVFSGSYAINPFNGEALPVWIADYVLASYGTGAIMAVPAHDSRDYAFARHFNLPIVPLIEGCDVSEESYDAKEGVMTNSGILNGLTVREAIKHANAYISANNIGRIKVNYRLRDAIFSRQRYWGEPFPIYYDQDGMPRPIPVENLPVELPEVDKFLPTETGEPPLGRAIRWAWDSANRQVVETAKIDHLTVFPLELCTMPGFAGSSAYYLHYMDPDNAVELVSKSANTYWRNVDLYIGGTEHATGHLIYSRFWNKFLNDINVSCEDEPFKKLINQGMIQGRSNFVYRIQGSNTFVSYNLKEGYEVTPLHVDVNIVNNDVLDLEAFRNWNPDYLTADFILEDGRYICGWAIEKMSKSLYNVVNPDRIVEKYGADTLRLYEMFLGPLEQSKPWDTNGIDGVHRFLKKLWALFYGQTDTLQVTHAEPTASELKALHKLIKKITYDIEHFSFNTSVSAFMICVNELNALKCNKKAILQPFAILISPFAPHIAEELWHLLGNDTTICDATWPIHNEAYLVEETVTYVISFNGKARFNIDLPAGISREEAEQAALTHPNSAKWMEGKTPKKVIVVAGKIVNIVIAPS